MLRKNRCCRAKYSKKISHECLMDSPVNQLSVLEQNEGTGGWRNNDVVGERPKKLAGHHNHITLRDIELSYALMRRLLESIAYSRTDDENSQTRRFSKKSTDSDGGTARGGGGVYETSRST